jgi:hypothetical protein
MLNDMLRLILEDGGEMDCLLLSTEAEEVTRYSYIDIEIVAHQ